MSIYNNESSLDASVRSIVGQSFQDWEMILWDDASTDGSHDLLLNWQQQESRIKVYSNSRNMGLAASLNRALEKSCGQYIARMDGDDVAMPDRLMRQVDCLDHNPQYAIVGAGCILFDEAGEWGVRYSKPVPQKKDFLWGSQFVHPATIMRRDALVSVGGYRVCRDTLRAEDYDLFMRMYAREYVGYNIREPLLRYFERRKPRHIKYLLRIREAKIRCRGFKELGLMPRGLPYIIKPLLVDFIPGKLKRKLQERRYGTLKGGS